jgi:hypothetical protein
MGSDSQAMTGKLTMKYLTGVVVLAVLGLSAPLHAQDQSEQTQQTEAKPPIKPAKRAASKKTGTENAAAATTDGEPKATETTKAEAPKKKKAAHAESTLTFDGTASTAEPKKSAPTRHSSAPAVVKEGGKTCSGKD